MTRFIAYLRHLFGPMEPTTAVPNEVCPCCARYLP